MTMLFILLPSIVSSLRKLIQGRGQGGLAWKEAFLTLMKHLPFIHLITHAKYDWVLITKTKEVAEKNSEIKDIQRKIKEQEGGSPVEYEMNKRMLNETIQEKMMLENEIKNTTADLQMFKMNEAYCESAPQFCLQLAILLREAHGSWSVLANNLISGGTGKMLACDHEPEAKPDILILPIFQLVSSSMSLLFTVSSLTVQLPVYVHGVRVVIHKGFSAVLLISVSNVVVITPKLVILAIAFATFRQEDKETWSFAIILTASWLIGYCTFLAAGIWWKKKKTTADAQETMELQTRLTEGHEMEPIIVETLSESKDLSYMGYVTAAFTPCVAHDIWANHFLLTSFASTFGYLSLAGTLLILIKANLLENKENNTDALDITAGQQDNNAQDNDNHSDALVGSIVCLVALPISLGLTIFQKKILSQGKEHLGFMMTQYRLTDFKQEIESGTISDLETGFFEAAGQGQLSTENIQAFLEAGLNGVNEQDQEDKTALIRAAEYGHLSAVESLIDANADLEKPDKELKTALMRATERGATEIVKALSRRMANLNQQDFNGSTALMKASEYRVAAVLIGAGADLDIQDEDGKTALMLVVQRGRADLLPMFIEAKADLNKQDNNGHTALIKAVKWNQYLMGYLIRAGADLNIQDKVGKTALITAVEKGDDYAAQQLIRAKRVFF